MGKSDKGDPGRNKDDSKKLAKLEKRLGKARAVEAKRTRQVSAAAADVADLTARIDGLRTGASADPAATSRTPPAKPARTATPAAQPKASAAGASRAKAETGKPAAVSPTTSKPATTRARSTARRSPGTSAPPSGSGTRRRATGSRRSGPRGAAGDGSSAP